MSKNLVIVESPAKAKTINKYLGSDYQVMASIGHIKDLPSKDLGVDIQNEFEPTYEVIPDTRKRNNKKVVSDLKKAAKAAENIYLAADPDREGEAICQHLAEEIVPKTKKSEKERGVYRVMFNEITKNAVKEAFNHPLAINSNLVDAQQARRILDRLVGYQVSPLLWKNIGGKLSAGRVQTVAVRLVVDREREIEAFVKNEYWTIGANVSAKLPPKFDTRLYKIEDKTIKTGSFDEEKKSETHIKDEATATGIVEEARQQTFTVDSVITKERKRNPVPPFITSKLQQEASRKLGFAVKKAMMVAQKLYEGIELGSEGGVGLITYMRTDSTRVSDVALAEVRDHISGSYGANYIPEKPIFYKSKKDAQDAHEAIRPTDVNRTPDSVAQYLSSDELKLYRLIWQRFVASQMMPAIFDQTTIDINAGRFTFRATGSVQKFDGFLKVYQEGRDDKKQDGEDEEDDEDKNLPLVEKGEVLKLNEVNPEQHFTEPPPRYTEATLVKALEERGIGRPSTYAAIMTNIQDREYIEKVESRFHPTALGTTVNDVLTSNFTELFNPDYTARMEDQLDEVEEGHLGWRTALKNFYDKFSVDLKAAEENIKKQKKQEIPTDEICEKCGSGMVIKFGRFGQFLACSNYPECKNTREVAKKKPEGAAAEGGEAAAQEEITCELCGKTMALRKGRFGSFYGCTGYPECKNVRKIPKGQEAPVPEPIPLDEKCPVDGANLVRRFGRFGEFVSCANYPKCDYVKRETVGVKCPKDGGDIVVKKSKRGKAFYGCANYPKCDAVYWDKPVDQACPQCKAPFVLEKTTKKEGTFRYCHNEECDYKAPVDTGATEAKTEGAEAGK
jgi:DNA topoisomerase-1